MLIIGHRGAKGLAPENTLASLQSALDARVDMIELDVRVTADGIPILNHDPELKSENGQRLHISKNNFIELQTARKDLLTLEAALQFIDRRADVIIEIKPGQLLDPIAAVIEPRLNAKWAGSDLILSSFDFKLLMKLHEKFPEIPIAVLEKWSGVRAQLRANKLGTKRITMNQKWLWSGFIQAMTRGGFKLSAYTLNSPRKAQRWEKAGLYGCITDHPELFLENYTRPS